ncbi:MAG: cell division protein FtsX [Epsilonproteobacteria bacterium]|nr:cell division protein FtsX [Campylobacterota bacterium]
MKSIKNHLSLIIALVSILFAIQAITLSDRAMYAYTKKLQNNYAVVVIAKKEIDTKKVKSLLPALIQTVEPIGIEEAIKKIEPTISKKKLKALEATLPKFYKITLQHYPSPTEIEILRQKLQQLKEVQKIEDFQASYDITYKLLLLFQNVVEVFSSIVFVITLLLILKELRIWQFKHKERMNIMGLFGAPKWLSSAVLFRLAIVDAVISSILVMFFFSSIASSAWIEEKFSIIGIKVVIFDFVQDFPILLISALSISILLAVIIVFGHKEEV